MIDPQLEGKVVLITGANHGIGLATVNAFTQQGATVFATYYRIPTAHSPAALQAAIEKGVGGETLYRAYQQQQPDTPHACELDLRDPDAPARVFDACEAQLGGVDILINNHAHCEMETFDPAAEREEGFSIRAPSAASIDAHFAINTRASVLLMKAYLARYLQRAATWGRIINISTDAAHHHPANLSYAASKYALESYTHSAATEMGKYGITVNVVSPGPIQTGYLRPEQEIEIARNTPLQRVGQPHDVADAIVLLASEQARWITGQVIYVGGGWRL